MMMMIARTAATRRTVVSSPITPADKHNDAFACSPVDLEYTCYHAESQSRTRTPKHFHGNTFSHRPSLAVLIRAGTQLDDCIC